jgi:hypothetical protein
VEVGHFEAGSGQGIQVRRVDLSSERPNVGVTEIIREYQNDIRSAVIPVGGESSGRA